MAAAATVAGGLLKAGSDVEASQNAAAGALVQAQAQANQDQESANLLQGQQEAAPSNASVAGEQAALATQTSNASALAYRTQADAALGTMRASAGASGAVLSGSALDVLKASAANAELNVLTIQHTGALEAWGYTNSENLDNFQAANAAYQETNVKANEAYVLATGQYTANQDIQTGGTQAAGVLLSTAATPAVNTLMPVGGPTVAASGAPQGSKVGVNEGMSMNAAMSQQAATSILGN